MGKWQMIARIYGYVVCLAAVFVGLASLRAFVEATFDLADPLHSEMGYQYGGSRDLTSFEAFKMEVLRSAGQGERPEGKRYVPDDKTIRTMYESAKAERIHAGLSKARRALAVNGLLLAACIALFTTHWRWLRSLPRTEA